MHASSRVVNFGKLPLVLYIIAQLSAKQDIKIALPKPTEQNLALLYSRR